MLTHQHVNHVSTSMSTVCNVRGPSLCFLSSYYYYSAMMSESSYVNCKVVVTRLKHLFHSVDKAVELRVWIDVEEVAGGQLTGHVKNRLNVIHEEAVVKDRKVSVCRDITHHVGTTKVRRTTNHHRIV